MKISRCFFFALIVILSVANACVAQEAGRSPGSLEKTLARFVHSTEQPRPDDVARALNVPISKATPSGTELMDNTVLLVYRMGANPWGITRIEWFLVAGGDGQHQTFGQLIVRLDKTFCLRPSAFAHDVDLVFNRMPTQLPDGGGLYNVDTYQSPPGQTSSLRVEAETREGCAKAVALIRAYGSKSTGPSIATLMPNLLATPFPAHPPYTAMEFWQRLATLIRAHDGYVAPNELQGSLDVAMKPITFGDRSVTGRNFHAHDDWYMSLYYSVRGPGYKSVQPGVIPDGQGSSLTIDIPDFTFLNQAGDLACLTLDTVESDLQGDHWEREVKQGPFGTLSVRRFTHGEKYSVIDVTARGKTNCVIGIRITGSLNR